jgi:hypothetical protein
MKGTTTHHAHALLITVGLLTTAGMLAATAGCAAGDQTDSLTKPAAPAVAVPPANVTNPASAANAAAKPPAAPAAATSAATAGWSTSPITVAHHPAVPPVPVVTAVRYAAHPESGYDRVVLDIPGALPGYTVKYVSQVLQDGSGKPVNVPGAEHLLIVLNPAQAHRDDGTATISGTHTVNLPMLKSYAVVGDYEGYVSIALGLNAKAKFHVGELSNRIYIDVAE